MEIESFIKNSFVDYPGQIACVVFTVGCNFDCWYCHNREIIHKAKGIVPESAVLDFLKERVGQIDAVVISGGEPTLQSDLFEFAAKVKKMGYLVKLDTNGAKPELTKKAIENKLFDYYAMDIKAPKEKYSQFCKIPNIGDKIEESMRMIQNSGVAYEFRTTFAPSITLKDVQDIVDWIGKSNLYALQRYREVPSQDGIIRMPHTFETIKEAERIALRRIPNTVLRGM